MKALYAAMLVGPVFILIGAAEPSDGGCAGLGGSVGTDAGHTGPLGPVCCGGSGSCTDGLSCCIEEGGGCNGDYDCCGGLCSGGDGGVNGPGSTCVSSGNTACIAALGSRCPGMSDCACSTDDDCCQQSTGAVCAASVVTTSGKRCCLSTGIPCGGNGDCCSGSCDSSSLACD